MKVEVTKKIEVDSSEVMMYTYLLMNKGKHNQNESKYYSWWINLSEEKRRDIQEVVTIQAEEAINCTGYSPSSLDPMIENSILKHLARDAEPKIKIYKKEYETAIPKENTGLKLNEEKPGKPFQENKDIFVNKSNKFNLKRLDRDLQDMVFGGGVEAVKYPVYMPIKEFARVYNLPSRTVYDLMYDGKIKYKKGNGKTLVSVPKNVTPENIREKLNVRKVTR